MTGLALVYLYFLIPLMVLTITPALEALRPQWREAADNLGASGWQYWRYVGGPVLAPPVIGATMLLFASAFAAYATAKALVGSSVPLVTLQIADALSSNVVVGSENLGKALALGMVAADRRSSWPSTPGSSGAPSGGCRDGAEHERRGRRRERRPPRARRCAPGTPPRSGAWRFAVLVVLGPVLPRPDRAPRCCSPSATAAAAGSPLEYYAGSRAPRASPRRSPARWSWPALTVVLVLLLMVPTVVLVDLRLPRLRTTVELLTLMPLVLPPIALVVGVRSVLSWAPDYFLNTPLAAGVLRAPEAGAALDPGAGLRGPGAAVRLPGAGRRRAGGRPADAHRGRRATSAPRGRGCWSPSSCRCCARRCSTPRS